MSPNVRIVFNATATYGRSLLSLLCGLFSSRWILEALGESNLGIFGVVGGTIGFITFLNGMLAGATGRFYAYYAGAAAGTDEGLEESRKWFNTALSIHTLLPVFLLIVGYPCGVWAVKNWLTIPPDRVDGAVWVFRFSCLTALFSMVNVPFSAMYVAKQYIAELTIYSVATTLLNFCFAYYMVMRPGDWLVRYGAWSCVLTILPTIVIGFRAAVVFKECRLRLRYLFLWGYVHRLIAFSGLRFLAGLAGLLNGNGIAIVINKAFGTSVNAAMGISSRLNDQTKMLSESLWGAFSPAITNAVGAGDLRRAWKLAISSEKICLLLNLMFCVPLAVELDEILRLWLKKPPQYTAGLFLCGLVSYMLCVLHRGHGAIINAGGRIAGLSLTEGVLWLLNIPFALIFVFCGAGPCGVGYATIITSIFISFTVIYFAKRQFGCSFRAWLFKIVLPSVGLVAISLLAGIPFRYIIPSGLIRIVVATLCIETALGLASWTLFFEKQERDFLRRKVLGLVAKLGIKSIGGES